MWNESIQYDRMVDLVYQKEGRSYGANDWDQFWEGYLQSYFTNDERNDLGRYGSCLKSSIHRYQK